MAFGGLGVSPSSYAFELPVPHPSLLVWNIGIDDIANSLLFRGLL